MPLLLQHENYSPHEFMFHYCAKEIHAVRYRPRHGMITWKAHYATPKWIEGTEGCSGLCHDCYSHGIVRHNPPLLFDITSDPSENHPLNPQEPQYRNIIKKIKAAVKEHQDHVEDVPNQLDLNTIWHFSRLQPCCNFPFCSCTENVTHTHP